jgi:Zn finger protein HypA/HybF involved in hydrogenase expression
MFCLTCKTKLDEGALFCRVCGRSTSLTAPVTFSANPEAVERKLPAMIRCNQCGYEGRSEFARSIPLQVIAWLCLFIMPLFTIIYFAKTKKYRCPKCKSTWLNFRNGKGEFVQQR